MRYCREHPPPGDRQLDVRESDLDVAAPTADAGLPRLVHATAVVPRYEREPVRDRGVARDGHAHANRPIEP